MYGVYKDDMLRLPVSTDEFGDDAKQTPPSLALESRLTTHDDA